MKKQRCIWMALVTVVLSVAMLFGTMTVGAFAEVTPGVSATATTPTVLTQLTYGETLKSAQLTGIKKIVAPNGVETTVSGDYAVKQIGAYTFYTTDGYSYVVPCKLEDEYVLRVEHNGADIPTYAAKGEITLPAAAVWVEDDDVVGGYRKLDGADYEVKSKVVGVEATGVSATAARKVTLNDASSYTVHYYCNVKGGAKYLFKEYTVRVQDDFTDDSKPSLSVVGVPADISLNTEITLPKATVTDNYDSNVKVTITVEQYDKEKKTYDGNFVKQVELDENGYAKAPAADAKPVEFDNEYNRSFYPTVATSYRITYKAVDDSGNEAISHEYTANASDKTAPKLIEIADHQIPTKWGIEVSKATSATDSAAVTTSSDIVFPYPEYVDNSNGKISVSFEIKDTVNNNTVISFSNIYDQGEDGNTPGVGAKYSYNKDKANLGLYDAGSEVAFTKDGFTFNFSHYFEHLDADATKTGTYTVTYKASDVTPVNAYKYYDILLENTFADTEKPSVNDVVFDDYYVVTATKQTFTVPKPVVSDKEDKRPNVVYKLASGANEIVVDGGETAELQLVDGAPVMTVKASGKKDQTLALGTELVYSIVATDDVGNVNDGKTNSATPIKILTSLSAPAAVEFTVADKVANGDTDKELAAYQLAQGESVDVGGFTWAVPTGNREHYGFELSLIADGKEVTTTNISYLTYFVKGATAEDNGTVHVENITFAAPVANESLVLYVRTFNALGVSSVKTVTFTVKGGTTGGGITESSANIDTSGNVYTTYTLKNKTFSTPSDIDPARNYGVRKITGVGKFSLMGNQVTMYNAGTFKFTDGYYTKPDGASESVFKTLAKDYQYNCVVTESETPAWHIQGEMPTYSELSKGDAKKYIELPYVVASATYANARIEMTVTDPDKNDMKIATATDADVVSFPVQFVNNGTTAYKFEATKNGTYTVTYTALYGDNSKLTQTYSIKVGDVVAPTFNVDAPNSRAVENSTFKFNEVKLVSTEQTAKISYKKTLKSPDGTEVYTVQGDGENYRKASTPTDSDPYKFTKTGIYTVEYTVTDEYGNPAVKSYTITVSAAKVNNPVSTKLISAILIIVGVLLIAGVILYFVRFRKVKTK